MTFEQNMKMLLEQSGMFPEQAQEVIELSKTDNINESMKGRWSDDVEGYPPMMVKVLWMSTKTIALQWIDENLPEAWYRSMFSEA